MNYKVKIKTGFRKDQEHSISADEAHKAYFLFLNPDARGIFKDGLAIRGADVQGIEADYQGTMGWNSSHNLDSDDWNEINKLGIDRQLRDILYEAKEIATLPNAPQLISLPLPKAIESVKLLS